MNETSILQAFNDPAMRHAILGHLPIALGLASVVATFASALRREARWLIWCALMLQLALAVAAFATVRSGESAREHLPLGLPAATYHAIDEHEEVAEKIQYLALVVAALVAVRLKLQPKLATASSWLAALGATFTMGAIVVAGHYGGLLVYQHRVISQTQPSFASPDPRVEFYKTEIAPLIAARCAECHNPERAGRGKSGRLDLTTIAGLLTGGKHKPAIIIGKSTESLLVKRVSSLDPQKIMPPEGEPLTAAQIEALKKWIDDGLAGMSK